MGQCTSLLAIVCFACETLAGSSWTEKLHRGDVQGFPSYDEANELLQQFIRANPSLLEKRQIGSSFQQRPIYAYILASPTGRQQKPQVLLTALMHAREPAGLTVLLYFLGHILDKYSAGEADAVYILNMREIWFVPFVNPDGYVANQGLRNKVIRKNRRPTCKSSVDGGVDINRNFAVHWSSSFGGCSEEHGGTQPFSEPETQAFKKICEENEFKTAMNFHAYGSMLTHPFNWATRDLMDAEDKKVYQEIARVFGFKKFGPAIKTVGYTTSGESDDWMYSARHIISMSPEVGPESGGFWPPSSQIDGINSRNFFRTMYVVGKAGMELQTEWVQQQLPSSAGAEISLAGGPPRSRLKLRIWNRGLTTSHGKVLSIAVRGVVSGESVGDASLLVLQDDSDGGGRKAFTAGSGVIAWQADAIRSRSRREFSIYAARSVEAAGPRSLQTCVAEESSCQCTESIQLPGPPEEAAKQSAQQLHALPQAESASARDSISSLCAAAVHGPRQSNQALSRPGIAAATSPSHALPTRMPAKVTSLAPMLQSFDLAGVTTPTARPSQGGSSDLHAMEETTSATWILLALGVTLMAMCVCMAMQPFIMPRRVARRAPSAIDYEQIPGLQVPRPDEDSDEMACSRQV